MTINDLKELGVLDLMPNGFNVYDSYNDNPISTSGYTARNYVEIANTWKVETITNDFDDDVPAIYVSKP